jgi:hypothetical protein
MVVMAWRQQVMKLGRTNADSTSTAGAANEIKRDDELAANQKVSARTKNVFKPGYNKSAQVREASAGPASAETLNSKAWEEKTAEELENELGIVVETARCDLEVNQLQHYIGAYLEAVHSKPQPKRQSQMTDALRILSGNLAIGELLTMAPLSTTSIIICCPPLLRLIPWHLLLIDVKQGSVPAELQESYQKVAPANEPVVSESVVANSIPGKVENKGPTARAPSFGEESILSAHLIEKVL